MSCDSTEINSTWSNFSLTGTLHHRLCRPQTPLESDFPSFRVASSLKPKRLSLFPTVVLLYPFPPPSSPPYFFFFLLLVSYLLLTTFMATLSSLPSPPTHTFSLSLLTSVFSPYCFSRAPWLWAELRIHLSGSLLVWPYRGAPLPPPLRETPWNCLAKLDERVHVRAFFWEEDCGRPYGPFTPAQFTISYALDFLCQRGQKAKNFNFSTFLI